ncbi:WD40-repeat-containing domain protein [Chytridium lagenaria]|nr:WD40-repeat-containing domain protein [Chytridium lagenaria]
MEVDSPAWLPFRRVFCHPKKPLAVFCYGSRFLAINASRGIVAKADDNAVTTDSHAHQIKAEELPKGEIKAVAFYEDLVAFASEDKILSVWNSETWNFVAKTDTPKRVAVIQFSPNGKNIVIADKFGDENTFAPPSLIIGHVSVITDMIFSTNGKYLITSDRDEKCESQITLSHSTFKPSASEIASSLPAIAALPNNENLIVSGGGEPFLLVWDMVSGERLQKLSWTDTLSASELEQEDLLVLALKSCPISQTVAVLIHGVKGVLLFSTRSSHLVFKERVNLPGEAFDIDFDSHGNIWGTYTTEVASSLVFLIQFEDGKHGLKTDEKWGLQRLQSEKVDTIPDYLAELQLLKKLSEEELQERRKVRAQERGTTATEEAEPKVKRKKVERENFE